MMRLVLNPDNAPLTPKEQELFDTLLDDYVRRQGFTIPGQRVKRVVNKDLLHSWNTVFFLRDAVQELRRVRNSEKARIAAEEEKARVAAELKKAEEAAAAEKAAKEQSAAANPPAPEIDPLAALLSVTGDEQGQQALQQVQQQQQEQQRRQLRADDSSLPSSSRFDGTNAHDGGVPQSVGVQPVEPELPPEIVAAMREAEEKKKLEEMRQLEQQQAQQVAEAIAAVAVPPAASAAEPAKNEL
jgi:hypothetical protein